MGFAILMAAFLTTAVLWGDTFAAGTKKNLSQKTFTSPEEAATSLVTALRANDVEALSAILGPDGRQIISSGDEVSDKEARELFVMLYEEKNELKKESDSKAVLTLGKDAWVLPIPIVKRGLDWVLDTKAGKEEILNRRIGKNELSTIQTCLAYVDAQREYASKDRDDDELLEYAQKIASEAGKQDGLYWEAKEGEEQSPLGPFAASAMQEGYTRNKSQNKPSPYHGYFYKILKAQGKSAPGGAYDYVVKDNMIGGFALVAYPAEYGSSGIMTFIVSHNGEVYEKDLGKMTPSATQAVKTFDPDETWRKVEPKYLEFPVKADGTKQ